MKRTLPALAVLATLAACGESEESYDVEFGAAASAEAPPDASGDAFADPIAPVPIASVQAAPVTNATPPGGTPGPIGPIAGPNPENEAADALADPAAPVAPPTLSADNHVAVVAALLDVYRGGALRERLLEVGARAAPLETGFADMAPGVTPESPTLEASCSNGGTARFELVRDGDRDAGWSTTFDGCQDGADVLDGTIRRTRPNDGPTLDLEAEGFGVERPDGIVSFDGAARWTSDATGTRTGRAWSARGASFTDTTPGATMALSGADYRYSTIENAAGNVVRAELDGRFTVVSPMTNGTPVVVETPESMRFRDRSNTAAASGDAWTFEAGLLRAVAADGSALLLQPANGDRDTVDVTISGGGETTTLVQPWSTWRGNLRIEP